MEKMEHKQVGEVLSLENNENTCRNVYILDTDYNIYIYLYTQGLHSNIGSEPPSCIWYIFLVTHCFLCGLGKARHILEVGLSPAC